MKRGSHTRSSRVVAAASALALSITFSPLLVAPSASASTPHVSAFHRDETARVLAVREFAFLARLLGGRFGAPYWVGAGAARTLVLPERARPWTLSDLETLAPKDIQVTTPGHVLVATNLVVLPGATLSLVAPGVTIGLVSDRGATASIVSLGGTLRLSGSSSAPLSVTGVTENGGESTAQRNGPAAYIRSIGGSTYLSHVTLTRLGSGDDAEGGLAATGSASISFGQPPSQPTSVLLHRLQRSPLYASVQFASTAVAPPSTVVPSPFATLDVERVNVDADAVGLYVTNSLAGTVADCTFHHNLFEGVDLHYNVSNVLVTRVRASDNRSNGIALDLADANETVTNVVVSGNNGFGLMVSGRALHGTGQGAPGGNYGSDAIDGVVATNNRFAGVAVFGGVDIKVRHARVASRAIGILVVGPSSLITVSDNTVDAPAHHGISLLNNVTEASLLHNHVLRAQSGFFLHDSSATIEHNVVERAEGFAVALTGASGGSIVTANTFSGHGFRAVDQSRLSGPSAVVRGNDESGWSSAGLNSPLIRQIERPATLLWLGILCILLVAWVARRPWRNGSPDDVPVDYEEPVVL